MLPHLSFVSHDIGTLEAYRPALWHSLWACVPFPPAWSPLVHAAGTPQRPWALLLSSAPGTWRRPVSSLAVLPWVQVVSARSPPKAEPSSLCSYQWPVWRDLGSFIIRRWFQLNQLGLGCCKTVVFLTHHPLQLVVGTRLQCLPLFKLGCPVM